VGSSDSATVSITFLVGGQAGTFTLGFRAAATTAQASGCQGTPTTFAVFSENPATISSGERQALIDLYDATGGANWITSTNWRNASHTDFNDPGTECTWYGVTCDAAQTTVLQLFLSDNLAGPLPTSLANLTNLQLLNLSYNRLTGSIPSQLGNLTSLTTLQLDINQLAGSIPSQLGNLSNLKYLVLSYNQLTGSIPSQLGNLTNLQGLGLDHNQLTGAIPTQLGNFTNLTNLELNNNQLTGSIPSQLGNLAHLQQLYLNANMLTGSITTSLENLTSLSDGSLNLNYNALYSTDGTLSGFLFTKEAGFNWQSTETVAPAGVATGAPTSNSVELSWTSIAYTGDTGGYRAYYSTTSGGPYTTGPITANKAASSIVVSGLNPATLYYFVVRTITNPNSNNQNTVTSDPSIEVAAFTASLPVSRLTITPSPNPASAGQAVSFAFSPALSVSGDSVAFNFGDGTNSTDTYAACNGASGGSACGQVSHTYASAGSFSVTASGIAGGAPVSGSTAVTVTQPCTLSSAPVAAFTYAPASLTVRFTDTSSGSPTSWAWNFGDAAGPFPAGASSSQNPMYTFRTAGTYTVTLTATNCKGSSQTSQVVTVSSCNQTVVPTASFTWAPQGPLTSYPAQQQPYVGQTVTLTDTSTGSPTSWTWHDFQELMIPPTTVTVPTFTATWTQPGDKNVRMTATNCIGTSAEDLQVVHVYPDIRPVVADFTWSAGTLTVGAPVTLTADTGPSYGDPDTFTWTFDDGSAQQSGASVTHTFTCAGEDKVTLTVSRSNDAAATAAATHTLTVTGQPQCAPLAVMTVDAAKVNGLNGTSWRTDVRIFNPSAQSSKVTVEFVPVNAGSPSGPGTSMTLAPNATWVFDDILGKALTQGFVGAGVTKAALRATFDNVDNVAPIVISDTYTSPPSGGGHYGELTPGIEVVPNTTPPVMWIAGIRNNGTTTGFRTNYSLVNLRSDAGVQNLKFTLFDPTGTAVATQTTSMNALEYRQDSLANLFGGAAAAVSPNPLAVRVDVPTGSDVQAYVSVMDNLTGDPVLIPAVPPPTSPIFLPAVGYTPGLNGTVWRADMQITNPDSAAPHTWEIRYLPKSGTGAYRSVTLAPQATTHMDDLLSWVFNGLLSADASTSGVVRIAPTDGSLVDPIVQARSFNQTSNGTFGQNITPITGNMGVAAGQGERLLLTGMSSQDIARTNLGFVNLSDTSSVVFSVIFYDEGGNVLNPKDGQGNPIPYTISLGVGGWDQDLLENRFKNTAGWPALGVNLKAISAVIQVTGGGPGTAYATVIDSQTGDPNFILAQPAP
jgi:PKD repeat protein